MEPDGVRVLVYKGQRLRLPRVPGFLARIHMTWTHAWRLNRRPVTVRSGSLPSPQLALLGPAHLPSAFLLSPLEASWLPQPLLCTFSLAQCFCLCDIWLVCCLSLAWNSLSFHR